LFFYNDGRENNDKCNNESCGGDGVCDNGGQMAEGRNAKKIMLNMFVNEIIIAVVAKSVVGCCIGGKWW
jgi:hypothetical protein